MTDRMICAKVEAGVFKNFRGKSFQGISRWKQATLDYKKQSK